MTNEDFDRLWEKAEAGRYATELSAEYPAWRRRQRRTAGMVAGVALVLAVATPLMLPQNTTGTYSKVYCNRIDKPAQQWVDMAEDLLIS